MGQKEDDGGDQETVLEPADGPHRLNWGLAGICLSVGPEQQLISASTQQAVCHGGRCSVTEPVIEGGSVCVTAKAWSASNSFGGGGSGQYKLIASYKDVAGAQQLRDFEMACRAEL